MIKFDMENKTSTNHENGNDANRLLADVYCPCCGLDVPQLFEGYCKPCLEEKQYELDTHNNKHMIKKTTFGKKLNRSWNVFSLAYNGICIREVRGTSIYFIQC